MLVRKAVRDVAAMGVRALLLVLVIGAGIGTAGGISLALHDVRASRDAFYRDQSLADLDVRLSRTVPRATLAARATAASATAAETRLVVDGLAVHGGDRAPAEVVGMSPQAHLDRLAVTGGHGLSDTEPRGAVVEAEYARRAGLRIGDTLDLTLGGHHLPVRVRGFARSPEYLLATANPEFLIPQPGSLAVVFVPEHGLATALDAGGQVNDLVLNLPPRSSPSTAQTLSAGLPVASVTPREEQYSLRFTNADLHSFALFVPVVGSVFAAVGFLLIGLSLRRVVQAQRRELGTMLAMGYRRPAVLATALLPAAALALPGAALAVGVTIGVARLVAHTYASAVGFPVTVATFSPALLGQAAAVAIGATLAAAVLPAWMLLRLQPAEAMRGERIVRFAPPRLLRRATGATGPAVSYASRSLARRPVLSVATVLSLALAIGLGASLNLLIDSTNRSVDEIFAGQRWTTAVGLTHPQTVAAARALARQAGATAVEPVAKGPGVLRSPNHSTDTVLVGLSAAPRLQRLHLTSGRLPAAGQIVLSEQTASSLKLRTGRPVEVTTSTGTRTMTVSGIARTLAGGQTYAPYADAAALLGLPGQANALYLKAPPASTRTLGAHPGVGRVSTLATARAGMHDLVRELTGLINVLLAISLGVGALFLVSSLALSLLDRQGEFATLRALGYGRARIMTILVTEALVQTLIAGALAVPAGILLAWPLADTIGQAWFHIGLHPVPSDFGVAIALAMALAVAAAMHSTRQVLRLNIAAAVRARLIG
ncbi:ABC transporter permease [Streptomyces sp. MUM 16J]|uniref:ABC transporter permease n=1 Tax=Streptomyces sp. MUM 16J TaxID=2791988 RepID=UPI001F03FDA8|nr:FtsX-like permease family protein [Streptomyces sp. MUM 16J]MCH0558850.1 FtsX-like permease family protein [Streptomyces sp. MUM 16J]